MFPYDSGVLDVLQTPPQTIAHVLAAMQTIDGMLAPDDGLKWFHGLYFEVTRAVAARVQAGGFHDAPWLAELDVQFARLYFDALSATLSGNSAPGCWRALFVRRRQVDVARIQFALAGMNAHINRDLPLAVVSTCQATYTTLGHESPHYLDYTAVNGTLDTLIQSAKQALMVRLLGDELPAFSRLEDTLAAWNLAAAREAAWVNAEVLWKVREAPMLWSRYLEMLDGLTALAGKTLLAPVPAGIYGASSGS